MKKYQKGIVKEEKIINDLHQRIRDAYPLRRQSADALRDWQQACHAFHHYSSAMTRKIDEIMHESHLTGDDLEFVLSYLEANPYYFRSGYIKVRFMVRLKRSALNNKAHERVIGILCQAVLKRGTQEYRQYCRLALVVNNALLREFVAEQTHSDDGRVKSRAKMMLQYLSVSVKA